MDIEKFLHKFRCSLESITEERFYSTERGFQAQLISELNNSRIGEAIVEQEYQKTLKNHGIRIRPDIIIHVPYLNQVHASRKQNNYVVIQLKKNATLRTATEDFKKIDLMFKKLDYPFGIFININAKDTFYCNYSGDYKDRIHCFSVFIKDGHLQINES
jgi:hypothetical protein